MLPSAKRGWIFSNFIQNYIFLQQCKEGIKSLKSIINSIHSVSDVDFKCDTLAKFVHEEKYSKVHCVNYNSNLVVVDCVSPWEDNPNEVFLTISDILQQSASSFHIR